jgi:hypothetical protein
MAQDQTQPAPTQHVPSRQDAAHRSEQFIQRLLGGPPVAVLGRLVLLSILVGLILAAIGLDPWNIIESVRALIVRLWTMGFDVVRWLWRYFLLGAVIVVPIWILVRLSKAQSHN